MATASFPADDPLCLLGQDYFDGPGEELWAPLVSGDEPDGWDAAAERIAFPPNGFDGLGLDAADPQCAALSEEWLGGGARIPGGADAGGGFGPGGPAEAMPAGSRLHALVEQAVTGGIAGMPDDALVGVVAAARRLRSHAELLEVRATREFAHRRWESGTGPERGRDGRWLFKGRDAEFAADELAFELVESPLAVQERMDLALALRDRLPQLDARLGNGVDLHRCRIVHEVTEALSQEHARQVDALLAPEAAGLRYGALRHRARKLAMMADPDAERERRERATRKKARVEVFPERSGNYAIAGRELPVSEVLASRAHIRAVALDLRAGGVKGSVRELDLMVFLDLTQGRDPRHRIPGHAAGSAPGAPAPDGASHPASRAPAAPAGGTDGEGADGGEGGGPWPFSPPGPGKPGGCAPIPAKINLLVPAGTLLGWSEVPGEAGREIIDPHALRDLVQASSRHPATRWCVTIVGADGTAVAHGCAKGHHPWTPAPGTLVPGTPPSWDPPPGTSRTRDGTLRQGGLRVAGHAHPGHANGAKGPHEHAPGPAPSAGKPAGKPPPSQVSAPGTTRARDAAPAAPGQERNGPPATRPEETVPPADAARPERVAQAEQVRQLLGGLKAAFEPIAQGACDHRHREDRYRPSRFLQDLVRARNATCPAPGCQASSAHCDLDHTRAWPDGDTDECNLGPPCRRDHRLKQAPGWDLTQPQPGFFRWKTPSDRVYNTEPTRYDV